MNKTLAKNQGKSEKRPLKVKRDKATIPEKDVVKVGPTLRSAGLTCWPNTLAVHNVLDEAIDDLLDGKKVAVGKVFCQHKSIPSKAGPKVLSFVVYSNATTRTPLWSMPDKGDGSTYSAMVGYLADLL
jgi:hypothetical protein